MDKLIAIDSPELDSLQSEEINVAELPASALDLVGGGVLVFDF